MSKSEYTFKEYLKSSRDITDLLVLYISIANNPSCSKEIRNGFNQMVENYCKRQKTSLNEISEYNGYKTDNYNKTDDSMPDKRIKNMKKVENMSIFNGEFTGKRVKFNEVDDLKYLNKGDSVVIINLEEFRDFLGELELVFDKINNIKKLYSS